MGTFDTIVDAASDYLTDDDGENAADLVDTFKGFFSDDDDDADDGGGGGGGGFGEKISRLFSSFDDGDRDRSGGAEGGGPDEDGWASIFGRVVDQLSGDGRREDLRERSDDSMADQYGSYLPEELRATAGKLLGQGGAGGRGSSWTGSLLDAGEGRMGMIADPIPGRVPDPRVSMPADLVGHNRDADGLLDRPGQLGRPGYDLNGDGVSDQLARPGRLGDADGDGLPDRPGYDVDGLPDRSGYPGGTADDDRVDYDDLVTSGAGPSQPTYRVPDDPTFPADEPGSAAVSGLAAPSLDPPSVEPPANDFQQSIDDADQADQSLHTMADDLEGQP